MRQDLIGKLKVNKQSPFLIKFYVSLGNEKSIDFCYLYVRFFLNWSILKKISYISLFMNLKLAIMVKKGLYTIETIYANTILKMYNVPYLFILF